MNDFARGALEALAWVLNMLEDMKVQETICCEAYQ